MLIHNKIQCKNCQSELKWFYHAADHLSSRNISVETYPRNEIQAQKVKQIDSDQYILNARCKICDSINTFQYQNNKIL